MGVVSLTVVVEMMDDCSDLALHTVEDKRCVVASSEALSSMSKVGTISNWTEVHLSASKDRAAQYLPGLSAHDFTSSDAPEGDKPKSKTDKDFSERVAVATRWV